MGALDGTHVEVCIPDSEKSRYRNRKGQISVNVLGVCNIEGKFLYALSGWEGSAADGRVFRDAVHRPMGIKVRSDDPLELEVPDVVERSNDPGADVVSTLDTSPQWTSWHDDLATDMYTDWLRRR
ncbi:UNVERIFIED_CONTAM: hypothetical protein Sradi_0704700 [Sesamum radiatum]|uniref:DDE Tnp4 domain-containing protein n=1 Tax=Sesamum radiatum TaxID=300843 RepID=A0AAW2VRP4_SESRA